MRALASAVVLLGASVMPGVAQAQRPNIVLMFPDNPWSPGHFDKLVADFAATTQVFPNVPPNSKDPYSPPQRRP